VPAAAVGNATARHRRMAATLISFPFPNAFTTTALGPVAYHERLLAVPWRADVPDAICEAYAP
jgi:hypothetical protein